MNFSFTDEQLMLKDSVEGFLTENADSGIVRQAMASESGVDENLWQKICAEMYWQAILVPEECGGLGLGLVEAVIVLEQMGRFLTPVPLAAGIQSALALRTLADQPQAHTLLAGLAEGRLLGLAHTAARPSWGASGVGVIANSTVNGWSLSGEARFIATGDLATELLVVAKIGSDLGLFRLAADQTGVALSKMPTMDQTRPMGVLQLHDVTVDPESCLSLDWAEQLEAVLDYSRIALGAEQVGCAQASLDQSVAYVSERVQFGRTIASYQAIKHKAADMMLKVESARSLLYYAACVGDEALTDAASSEDLQEAAAMLASSAGDAAFFCAGTGIQLHGGVGITEEYDIQLYFKRARSMEAYLGRPDEQREVLAAMLLDQGGSHAA
ncbi:MAG: acyl-CoA dehydrogenase [Halieaceae bacterium]|nr:acyl-CoA dehydrogenase [Halieaceae bacterium]MBT5208498.1 acyl-CoA dehydrogenase [Halieaceae bacterium]MDG2136654.1 acyl-CoA/acyl-ACP dehydrogenase [Luminiphilus sp.]